VSEKYSVLQQKKHIARIYFRVLPCVPLTTRIFFPVPSAFFSFCCTPIFRFYKKKQEKKVVSSWIISLPQWSERCFVRNVRVPFFYNDVEKKNKIFALCLAVRAFASLSYDSVPVFFILFFVFVRSIYNRKCVRLYCLVCAVPMRCFSCSQDCNHNLANMRQVCVGEVPPS